MHDDRRLLKVLAALGIALFAAAIGIRANAQTPADEYSGSLLKTPDRPAAMPQVVRPSQTWNRNGVTALRDRSGHFFFDAAVNGTPMRMIFDTGATDVILRAEDAAQAGIDINALTFSARGETANGSAQFARTVVSVFTVGSITRRNMPIAVAKPGKLSANLLGQTFLARLASYKQEGERLTLQGE